VIKLAWETFVPKLFTLLSIYSHTETCGNVSIGRPFKTAADGMFYALNELKIIKKIFIRLCCIEGKKDH